MASLTIEIGVNVEIPAPITRRSRTTSCSRSFPCPRDSHRSTREKWQSRISIYDADF